MDEDQWITPGLCMVSVAHVEQLRAQLEQLMHRRLELDAWEMECQMLRAARLGQVQRVAAPVRAH